MYNDLYFQLSLLPNSNPDLTMALATGCKQRGVHAFGPIFDS